VTAGGGVAVSTAAALGAAALGAVDVVVPPQADTTIAMMPTRAVNVRGPNRERFILVFSSSLRRSMRSPFPGDWGG
jgi:hypothetical protein